MLALEYIISCEVTLSCLYFQIEVNPYFVNDSLVKFCQSKDVQVTAYSPLGSADRPWASKKEPVIMDDPQLIAIADKVGKSVPQVMSIKCLLKINFVTFKIQCHNTYRLSSRVRDS